jgi:DNA-binding XRE family transcriptional regulator
MILNENEYQKALQCMDEDKIVRAKQRKELKKQKFTDAQIEKALEPMESFHEQLSDEVKWYERMKRRDIGPISRLSQIGRLLIGVRLASGVTQAELAKRLKVSENQVLRDERNEYHGVSLIRAQEIFDVCHVRIHGKIEVDSYEKEK